MWGRRILTYWLALHIALVPASAFAQSIQLGPGEVIGNPTTFQRPGVQSSLPSLFDRAFCSTVGYAIFRATGVWKCDRRLPISITLFGAVADSGVTDNQTFIQATVDYAAANGIVGIKIPGSNGYFASGCGRNNAMIDMTSLTVPNGNKVVSIYGDGWSEKPFATPTGSWILPTSSFPNTCSYILLDGDDKVAGTVYDGFGIGEFGGSLGTPKGLHGIFIRTTNPAYYQQNMRINNVYIGNTAAGYSIKCTAGSPAAAGCIPDSTITHSKFMNFHADYLADHVTITAGNTVGQNATNDSRNVGFQFANCNGCTTTIITQNSIVNTSGALIYDGGQGLVFGPQEIEQPPFTNLNGVSIWLRGSVSAVVGATIDAPKISTFNAVNTVSPITVGIAQDTSIRNPWFVLPNGSTDPHITITSGASGTTIRDPSCYVGGSHTFQCNISDSGAYQGYLDSQVLGLSGAIDAKMGRLTAPSNANGLNWKLPSVSGTLSGTASSPIVLNSTTGNITCPSCATTAGASIPAIAQGDLLYGSGVNTLAALAKSTGSSNFLKNSGTSNNPAWAQPAFSDISSNLTLAQFPSLATNTVLSNATAGSAVPTALAVASCSTSSSALNWTTNTGFGCNTAIAASTATTATNATNGTTVAVTTNASFFPLFVASSSNGSQPFNLDTTFTYNPSTDTLTATNFAGNASTATTVTTNANLTGDVTSVGNATTLTNAPVIAKVLTSYTSGAGTVSASDSILSAIQKLNGNDALKAPLASPTFTGTATIPTVAATTINAFTLAGTIAGGGNNLNNIIIGQTTPLAGSFTTLSASTSVTSPLHIGGSGTTGTQLTFKTTTGSGTTDAFAFVGGNNGGTSFGTWDSTALTVAANLGVGGSITGTQTGAQITSTLQPMLVARATGGAATKQMARFTYDPASSLTNPGFLFQSLTDAGAFATNDNVFWGAGGGISVGSLTYPGVGGVQISGQIFMPSITTSSAAQTGTVCWTTGTGKFTVDTTVGCLTSIMAAKNITERLGPAKALGIVTRLDPFAFRYKSGFGDGGRYEQFGFGAEEVAAVDERLVGRDPEGTLQGVRYQEMAAVLAGAIQQLKADNDNLRSEVAKLKQRIER